MLSKITSSLEFLFPTPTTVEVDGNPVPQDTDADLRTMLLATSPRGKELGFEYDRKSAIELCHRHGITADIATRNWQLLDKRFAWSELLQTAPEVARQLQQKTERLEARQGEIDAAVKAWKEERMAIEVEIRNLEHASTTCMVAESELLASGAEHPESLRLGEELQHKVHPRINWLQKALSDRWDFNIDIEHSWPRLDDRPAALARAIRNALKQKNSARSADKTSMLRRTLKIAESRVKKLERELIDLEKRRRTIMAKQEELAQERLKPENFEVIRKLSKSNMDRMRENARHLGHSNPFTEGH